MQGLAPPHWIKSDGTNLASGATLAAGTYYAPIRLNGASSFGGTFIANAALVATATVDGNDLPITETTFYGDTASAAGWTDCANVPDTVMNASAGAYSLGGTGSVLGFAQSAARIKLVVTTAGTCEFYPTVKGDD